MKSKNTDTRNALGLLLILVLIAAGSLAACGADEPAALLDPNASYTPEKVRVQWLIADKTTVQQGGLTVSGPATFSGGATLDSLTVSGATALDGGLTMDTSKFTVADATGNTLVGGTLDVRGMVSDGAGPLALNDNTSITGTLTASDSAALNGGITVDTTNFSVSGTTGDTIIAGSLSANGGISVDAGNFSVDGVTAAVYTIADITAGTTLYVTGLSTLAGGFAAGADGYMEANQLYFDLGHTAYIDAAAGNLDITVPASSTVDIENGGLTVAGTAAVTGTLTITGLATFDSGLTTRNDLVMRSQNIMLDLGHTAYINGAAGSINIATPLTGTVHIVDGDLAVDTGDLAVAGDVTVNGVKLVTASTGDLTLKAGASIYPTTATTNTGTIFTCAQSLVYTEVTSKGVCVIPANANVVDAMLSVSTGFNGSGTDTVSCGYTYADPNEIFDDISIESAAVGRLATTAGLGDIGAAAKTVWCKYVDQNSNASAGAMTILIYYVVD